MSPQEILTTRIHNQLLLDRKYDKPEDIASWFGAIQSQDYLGAKWALSQRFQQGYDEVIERSFNEGRILRTHAMRPTWHFVAPEDILWIEELTVPRVKIILSTYDRKLEIDVAFLKKTQTIIRKVLKNNNYLTREEIADYLGRNGITPCIGQRLGHIVMHAELDGVICSGPRKGKQFTYALIEERAPQAKELSREEALKLLTEKYFRSHGPACVQDFVWWSGLMTADARKGIEMNNFDSVELDGITYWFKEKFTTNENISEYCYLLPNYDEYTIAYKDRSLYTIPGEHKPLDSRGNVIFNNAIILNGKVAGTWRRTLKSKEVIIEYIQFYNFNLKEKKLFEEAVKQYAAFLERKPKTLQIH